MTINKTDTTYLRPAPLNFINIIAFTLMHLGALTVFLFKPSLRDLSLFFIFYVFTGFGVTIGFHRLLTHNGFQCNRFIKYLFAFFGTAALQGGPIWWVGIHRRHHQKSDRIGDVHSPVEGFWHSHIGWMLRDTNLSKYTVFANELKEDPFIFWLQKLVIVPWLIIAVATYLIGGWTGLVWGTVFRTIFLWHATWSVNSICHIFGKRPHDTPDKSGNVWWVGLWALGEGWHNNHHAYPKAAIHKYHWWEIDFSGYLILILEKLHLVHNIIQSKPYASQQLH